MNENNNILFCGIVNLVRASWTQVWPQCTLPWGGLVILTFTSSLTLIL